MIADHASPVKFKREGISCDNYLESADRRRFTRIGCVVAGK
jgi:hypothetical protein